MAKTFDEIINNLITNLKASIGNVDTRVGTILRDAFLTPESAQFLDAYGSIDTISANQGVNTAQSQSDAALENLASNYGITRFGGTYASGIVTFYRYSIPGDSIAIPAGTVVATDTVDGRITFKTITTVSLSTTADFDNDLNAFYVDVFVICDLTGTLGNAAAGSINYVALPGIDGVTNRNDMSNGRDIQTNDEIVALIKSSARGNLGTRTGYEAMVRENFAVGDVKIITPDDIDYARTKEPGSIDVIILSDNRVTAEEDLPFISPAVTTKLTPTFLPLMGVSSLEGVGVSGDTQTLLPTTDYDVVYDTYSDYRRSQNELSRINLHITSFVPKNDSMIHLVYETSSLVAVVQAYFERDENKAIGADLMVKMGMEIPAAVTGTVKLIPGYTPSAVKEEIENALVDHFAALLLDDDVQVSDVLAVIANVTGVDSVDVPGFILALAETPTVPVQEITANKQEYIRLAKANINLTVGV